MQTDYLPMNAAALMDRVFELYRDTFKMQIAFSLIIGIISFVLMMAMVVTLAFGLGIFVAVIGLYDEHIILGIVIFMLAAMLPLYMIWLLLSASGHILISKQAFYGEPIELPFKDLFLAFLRIISAGLAQIILSIPWIALLALVIYLAVGQNDILLFIEELNPFIFLAFGFVYIILYVIYSNIFTLSIPVAIFEERVFFTTITRSFDLLRGDFFRILALRLLWALLVFIFSYSAQGLMMFLVGFITFSGGAALQLEVLWLATYNLQVFISMFVAILIAPMEGILTALIYFNQKIKKEGLDIEIGLDRLSRGYTT